MNKLTVQRQSGFTLVEIAIVLVIIGLLLGGVLKGTELIENSKVKRTVNDINGVSAAYNAYLDRYRRPPGDDGPLNELQARGGNWADISIASTNRNGVIDSGNANNALNNPANESVAFWQHLRAAGYISGDPSKTGNDALPLNAFGGRMGITLAQTNGGLNGFKLCMNQVVGSVALAIDNQLDDGSGLTGNMRASLTTGTTVNTALTNDYDEEETYSICVRL